MERAGCYLRWNRTNYKYYSYRTIAVLAVRRGTIPIVTSRSLIGTTQNPPSESEYYHLLHPHHDVLHSYGQIYAQLINAPIILGLSDSIHHNLSDNDGNTQLIDRK